MTVYFENPGRQNTEQTAMLAIKKGKEQGIKYIVVASNTGHTANHFVGKGFSTICVTHHVGFREKGCDEMNSETRQHLKAQGVKLLTTTHLFGNVERAVTNKFGGLYPGGLISETLRMLSQGTKVAVEISIMALDAGLIPHGEPIIAVGGTGGGADSAVVIKPAHAKELFDTEILEIICKPRSSKKQVT